MIQNLIPTTIRMSTPLALAALGGTYSERSGVVNIALEGMMLMGAFGYVTGTEATRSTWLGLVIGIGFGVAIALLHAVASITFRADQIVSGVAINLLTIGITEFLGRGATSRRVEGPEPVEFTPDWGVCVHRVSDPSPCDCEPDSAFQNRMGITLMRGRRID